MNYSELLQLTKGWGNFVSDRINIWRLLKIVLIAEKTAAATNSCHIVAYNFHIVGRVQLDKSVYYCYQNQVVSSNL